MASLPEENLAPMAFRNNHSSTVCLPVLAGRRKLAWVHSDQVELGGAGAGELDEAFDRFPYLSRKETAALAQRCALHPDQVKVWFMAQRLRYGISWEWQDIANVRRAFRSEEGRAQAGAKDDDGERKKRKKPKKKTSVQRKAREEEEGAETTQEKSAKVGKIPVVKKKKRDAITGEEGTKRVKRDHGERTEGFESAEGNAGAKTKKKQKKAAKVKDEEAPLAIQPERRPGAAPLLADDLSELLKGIDLSSSSRAARRPSQMAMMRTAFLRCQYPNARQYASMAAHIGVPRTTLVQWFNDTRYHVKRGQPRWMSHRERREMAANVRYRQYLSSLAKEPPADGETWDAVLEKLKSSGEEESPRGTKPFTLST